MTQIHDLEFKLVHDGCDAASGGTNRMPPA
jgi:hypothetical protein